MMMMNQVGSVPVGLAGLQLPQHELGVVAGGGERDGAARGGGQHVVGVPRLPALAARGRARVLELRHVPVPAHR